MHPCRLLHGMQACVTLTHRCQAHNSPECSLNTRGHTIPLNCLDQAGCDRLHQCCFHVQLGVRSHPEAGPTQSAHRCHAQHMQGLKHRLRRITVYTYAVSVYLPHLGLELVCVDLQQFGLGASVRPRHKQHCAARLQAVIDGVTAMCGARYE